MDIGKTKIGIIGLGYVGLPLAVAFAKKYPVVGFDISQKRVADLLAGNDFTLEVSQADLKSTFKENNSGPSLHCTNDLKQLQDCNVFIVTVPTPVDKHKRPDLGPLYRASETVGKVLNKGDVVIYESTVYPGVTEDECVPVIERISQLTYNKDFFCGYSPERINPGDKEHTITKIMKVTSGSTHEAADFVDSLYNSIITAGTFKASSIKVAEAAKVIENSQRDINIAFVNELAKIFNRMGIDTNEVLDAAGSKWNFLHFRPGLVGGHCIGVDPYYLAEKAQELGYHPEIILAGRRLNDSMGPYIVDELIKRMVYKGIQVVNSDVLVLGFTFKENCPDVRNTKVIDIIRRLNDYHMNVTIHDPWANSEEVKKEYGVTCLNGEAKNKKYDAILLAVAHKEFKGMDMSPLSKPHTIIYDIKGFLPAGVAQARL